MQGEDSFPGVQRRASEAKVCTSEARKIKVPLARARSRAPQESLVSLPERACAQRRTLLGTLRSAPAEGVAEECAGAIGRRTLETGEGVPLRVRGELEFEENVRRYFVFGRYVRKGDKRRIAEAFAPSRIQQSFLCLGGLNIAPATYQPIIRVNKESSEREMVPARWSLVPFFTKELSNIKGLLTINIRGETIMKAPTWRELFKNCRCLIPAHGLYEWPKEGTFETALYL